jgi:hypothetical protein
VLKRHHHSLLSPKNVSHKIKQAPPHQVTRF